MLTQTKEINLLQAMVDNQPEMTCLFDNQLRIICCNDAFKKEIKRVLGFIPDEQFSFKQQIDGRLKTFWLPIVERASQGIPFQQTVKSFNNTPDHFFDIDIQPLRYNESIMGVMVKAKDVTTRTQNENNLSAFRELAANLPNTDVFYCNQDLNIILASGMEMKKHGIDYTEYEGKNFAEIMQVFQIKNIDKRLSSCRVGDSLTTEFSFNNNHYLLDCYPIIPDQQIKNIVFLVRNVTDYKTINNKLEKLNQEKDNILGVVAHDLRNPISAVLGLAEMMSQRPDLTMDYLNLIEKSATTALSTINDLLDVSELGKENFILEKDIVEVNELIRTAIDSTHFFAKRKRISVIFVPTQTDVFIWGNADKLIRLFSNLISNAIKFSNTEQYVNITCEVIENMVLINIIDQGIGIPAEYMNIIFNKFTKAGRVGTAGEKSLGLGMNIVKQIVQLHGGEISLESAVNKGTKVLVKFESAI
ncbi:MAG: PAS domain-containing sensor histidine kinase [Bacteroidia bacterium]|jgi:signal transduction histidine kinase|nr:PAS domain-containing sensor histidine kinase [Bacteroidia bacterium]